MEKILIQAVGWAGMAVFLLSYQLKSNKKLYILQAIGAGLFCLQFCLMGAFSGCISLFLIIIRGLILNSYHKAEWVRWYGWTFVFTVGFAVVLVLTWAGLISLLPFTASVVSTFGYWTNNAGKIRLSNLCIASPCWIVYDFLVGSYGGIASELLTMVSIIISIRRFGWKHLSDENSSFQA